jgi:hypothetical protein
MQADLVVDLLIDLIGRRRQSPEPILPDQNALLPSHADD